MNIIKGLSFNIGYIGIHMEIDDITQFISAVHKREGWKIKIKLVDMWYCETREFDVSENLSSDEVISKLRGLVVDRFHFDGEDNVSIVTSKHRDTPIISKDTFFIDEITIISDVHGILDEILKNITKTDKPEKIASVANPRTKNRKQQEKKDKTRLGWFISNKLD
jgi:hypothetical protein